MTTRVVLDTNVLVSSFFGGNPRRVIDLWKTGQITLCLSRAIVEEYITVLIRLGLQDDKELDDLLSLFSTSPYVRYIHEPAEIYVVASDPDDDKFFACAVALQAEYIISGDQAVIDISNFFDIHVLSPAEFLRIHDSE
ncbi:MAG: putative toxin-antitoxin system toxin component, PIN family [Anaerolineales bacterium]|nr:putative toxin-antitoxin system toxin component, PIN family [Anaerolineales bacterium]